MIHVDSALRFATVEAGKADAQGKGKDAMLLSAAMQDLLASVVILAAALPLFVWPHLVDRIVAVYVCAVVAVGVVASI